MAAKKRFNPSVRNAKTFQKKALKVGRTLRHDNATDTRVSVKKIGIVEQLREGEGGGGGKEGTAKAGEVGQKGVDELVAQLGHYNENISRDAVHGVRLLFKKSPELLGRHLRRIIPAIGSLIIRELKSTASRNQLKLLIEMICEVPEEVISSQFGLFCGFVLTGISDVRASVRLLCFDILSLLMRKYVQLCRKSREIFDAFLQLMGGQRKPENRAKLLDSLSRFLGVFGDELPNSSSKFWPERTLAISFGQNGGEAQLCTSSPCPPALSLLPSPAYFHFPVIGTSADGTSSDGTSPLLTREGLLNCCKVICPLVEALIRAENEEDGAKFSSIMGRAHCVVSRLVDVSLRVLALQFDGTDALRGQIVAIFAPLRRCPLAGASKKLAKKMDALTKNKQMKTIS